MSEFAINFLLWALCAAIGVLCTILWYLFNKVNSATTDILLLKQAQETENSGIQELKKLFVEFQTTLNELVRKVDGIVINEGHTIATIERLEKDIERIENAVK